MTNSPTKSTTIPLWSSTTPARFHDSLNRTRWAASRLANISPPMSLPPGKGNEPGTVVAGEIPKKICPNCTANWRSIHTT